MSVATDQNDLLFLLENAETSNEVVEAIDSYLDCQVSYAWLTTMWGKVIITFPLFFSFKVLINHCNSNMNDYEPDFNYDQDDYIEDDIISQLNESSVRDNLSPETQQLINNFKRKWN